MKKIITMIAVLVSEAAVGASAQNKDWETKSVDGQTTYTYIVQPDTVKSFIADGKSGWSGIVVFEATGQTTSTGIVVVTGCDTLPEAEGLVAFFNEDGSYISNSTPFAWSSSKLRSGTAREFERIAALVCVAGKLNSPKRKVVNPHEKLPSL